MFTFKHMKTPVWAKENDIYFLVLDEEGNEYGYIGLQDVNFSRGVCGNLCYKTHKRFRGKGRSKQYLKEFLDCCPFEFDIIKASVKKDNIASIKMLEYCDFKKQEESIGSYEKELKRLEGVLKSVPKDNKVFENRTKADIENVKEKIKKEISKGSYQYKLKKFDY